MKKFILSLLCVFASVLAFGQSGEVQGKVTDTDTGEGLPFANVYVEVEGVPRGAQTDFDGFYSIKPLPPGNYTVIVEYLGYQKQEISGVQVNADQARFLDIKLAEESELLAEVLVVAYSVPLIEEDKGNTTTVTAKDIANLPTRSVGTIASTSSGVYQQDQGDGLNIKGSRDNATLLFIDGVKVRGNSSLPASAIEQMSVVTGGIPAKYGDATGGIINITTRGATSDFNGGVELITSQYLDQFHHNFASGSLSGPLLKVKKKGTDFKRSVMGFFLAGEVETNKDNDAPAIDIYRVKDEVFNELITNPLRPADNGAGYVRSVDYVTLDDLERIKTREGVRHLAVNLSGNITISPSDNIDIRVGGSTSYDNDGTPLRTYELFNEKHHRKSVDQSYRGYVRFSQRFGSKYAAEESQQNTSVFSNAYYSIQYDYTKSKFKGEDQVHGDDYFAYGHVGKFATAQTPSYDGGFLQLKDENGNDFNFVNSVDGSVLNFASNNIFQGFINDGVSFDGSGSANPIYAAQTSQYLNFVADNPAAYNNIDQIVNGNGLINGGRGTSASTAHSMYYMPGFVYPFNFFNDNDQHRVVFNGSVDFKKRGASDRNKHAIEFGVELEQRIDRYYEINAPLLWDRIRQSVSQRGGAEDIRLDLANPYFIINGQRILVTEYDENVHGAFDVNDTIDYNYVRVGGNSFFDTALRNKLGLGSTDYVDFFNLNPSDLSMDMFTADELFGAAGSDMVDYYGYDHTGKKLNYQPSFEDFFTSKKSYIGIDGTEVDYFDRPMGAFRPIYIAGYVQDKFTYKDLVFNVGVRVDRYDSNQKVMKDKYSLYGVRTVAETLQDGTYKIGNNTYNLPETIGDDFVVYVNDASNPTSLNGFRDGDTWYNASGEEVTDPQALATSGSIFPYLSNPQGSNIQSENFDINSSFKDYKPQISVMPRVAVSFKMNENASFFAHYNVLTQRPQSRSFVGPDDYYYFIQRASETFNNANLQSEKTIGYEIGFRQALSKSSAITISAYYKELRDMIQVQTIRFAYPIEYTSYSNIDFGTVKGFEVGFDQRRVGNVRFTANYNLAFAEATGSGDRSGANLAASGQPNLRTLIPLDYDARHTINLTFDYRFAEGSKYNGPMLGEWRVLENAGANFIFSGRTGTPYTRQRFATPEQLIGVAGRSALEGGINGSRLPATFRVDLKVDKDWKLGKGAKAKYLNTYVLVQNLLNTKNITNVYSFTNSPVDDGYLSSPLSDNFGETEVLLYNIRQQNPNNYTLPRRIRLGVSFNF